MFIVLEVIPITVVTFWFFGISLLALVPLWQWFLALLLVRRMLAKHPSNYLPLLVGGLCIPLAIIIMYTARWQQMRSDLEAPFIALERPLSEEELPTWVLSAQAMEDDLVTERILKSRLVYQVSDGIDFWRTSRLFNEKRKHDPFVTIADVFGGRLDISTEDRIKLLNARFGQRHQTQRTLWSGRHLETNKVKTQVQLFPEYRLSYTEKTITVQSKLADLPWRRQEAFYTFYLPEGATVTSASLWIEGEERPAYLTTRSK
ncbi:MAG: XrtN system VIT domain-containing protein, partial [Bacteroidota bacterium]